MNRMLERFVAALPCLRVMSLGFALLAGCSAGSPYQDDATVTVHEPEEAPAPSPKADRQDGSQSPESN